jgi:hypothetical protein
MSLRATDVTDVAWEDTSYATVEEFPDLLASQLTHGVGFDFCIDSECTGEGCVGCDSACT